MYAARFAFVVAARPGIGGGRKPLVDCVDLILGAVMGRISKTLADGVITNPEYNREVHDRVRVVASFSAADWQEELGPDGRVWQSAFFLRPSGMGECYSLLWGTTGGKHNGVPLIRGARVSYPENFCLSQFRILAKITRPDQET